MSRHRLSLTVLMVCSLLAMTLLGAATASARVVFGPSTPTVFGEAGAGEGQFDEPAGIAIDETTHDVYVVDRGNKRVEIFDSAGKYLSQFNGSDDQQYPEGFVSPTMIAVDNSQDPADPSKGDVYVLDSGAASFKGSSEFGIVEKFDASGKYLLTLREHPGGSAFAPLNGVSVAPSGEVWVDLPAYFAASFSDAAEPEINKFLEIPETGAVGLGSAVDGSEDLYVSVGSVVEKLHEGRNAVAVTCACATGLAVDQASGELLVDEGAKVLVYDSTGAAIDQPIGAGYLGAGGGLAVSEESKDVYVADTAHDDVDIFPPLALADVTSAAVTDMRGVSLNGVGATFNGSVDPGGLAVSECYFEYGTSTSYAAKEPCTQTPSGASAVTVTASPIGLRPGTGYHYRLVAVTADGPSYGADESFTTPPTVAGSGVVSGVTSFAVTLHGVIDPGLDFSPSYHFVYGITTAYGSSVPEPDAGAPAAEGDEQVSQPLAGLQPDTTYHFALIATNPGGGVTIGPDATFTTRPLVPPVVSTGGAEGIVQTTATLAGVVNPEGLATSYGFEYGPTTGYGSSWPLLAVAAGSGGATQGVAVTVPNLQPGSTYHYRLVATNEDGTSYGADLTFTTPGYPASAIQETPISGAKLGFIDPEATRSSGKPAKPKGKGKAKRKNRRPATNRRRAKKGKGGKKG